MIEYRPFSVRARQRLRLTTILIDILNIVLVHILIRKSVEHLRSKIVEILCAMERRVDMLGIVSQIKTPTAHHSECSNFTTAESSFQHAGKNR